MPDDRTGNLTVPDTANSPATVVEPVIDIVLPDILVSRYIKLPSASLYANADPLIVIALPGLANDDERNNNPIIQYVYNKYAKRMAPQMRSHYFIYNLYYFLE